MVSGLEWKRGLGCRKSMACMNFGTTGWTSIEGDWNGDGTTKIGVYKDGVWYLDYNGDGMFPESTGISPTVRPGGHIS